MNIPHHSSVLIVGAGPTGLMMAAQLLRNGIQPLIIDSKTGPTGQSRALAVQARSLEILRQLELDDLCLQQGKIARGLALHTDTYETARLDLSGLGKARSPFPFVLILEQSKTERILLDYLTAHACPVFWNTELLDLDQTEDQVTVKIRHHEAETVVNCNWLAGADGGHSRVRKSLAIPFAGGTYEQTFYLADLTIRGLPSDAIRLFLKKEGFTGFFPMKEGSFRFIGILPRSLRQRENVKFDDLKPYLTYTLDFPINEERCNWFTTYQLHHRMAGQFHDRHCFLIGDAAHIHSPAGGQGMNTGFQDAYNLAWKLAGVIKGQFHSAILSTYSAERMPVARNLLKTTDRLFTVAVAQNWFIRLLRNHLLPFLAKRLGKNETITGRIFSLVSQTAISYRKSVLSVHHSRAQQIKAGDRVPYLKFYDEKLKKEIDLHSWCHKTGFTLIVMGKLSLRDLLALARWIRLNYPFNLNFYYLPPSERNSHVFQHFEIIKNGKKTLVVRPDMHIGYMNDIVDVDLIGGYLKEVTGN